MFVTFSVMSLPTQQLAPQKLGPLCPSLRVFCKLEAAIAANCSKHLPNVVKVPPQISPRLTSEPSPAAIRSSPRNSHSSTCSSPTAPTTSSSCAVSEGGSGSTRGASWGVVGVSGGSCGHLEGGSLGEICGGDIGDSEGGVPNPYMAGAPLFCKSVEHV